MSSSSQGIMILLMLIGGSPCQQPWWYENDTFAVLLANIVATYRQQDSAHFFDRRVDYSAIKTASTILTAYITLFFSGGIFISAYENLPLSSCLYETASALGTVGLTLGNYTAAACTLTADTDFTYVSWQSRQSYAHVRSIIRQKSS